MRLFWKQALMLLVAGIIGGIIGISIYQVSGMNGRTGTIPGTEKSVARYTVDRIALPTFDFSEIASRIGPTVVHITTKIEAPQKPTSPFDNPFFEFFDPKFFNYPQQGSGSGVIVTEDGYIVTNNHVVADATNIEVTLSDKRTYSAKVIGKDPQTDLAVIKIDAKDLTPLPFGNSDELKVGEWVLALGNPFNLESTITAGIVSAKARSIGILGRGSAVESFIQTDAAVNPGNSGGALVNVEGKLIGINTAIASQTGTYEGYAFAIPSNLVYKVYTDIVKYGKVQRGMLGINIQEVTQEIAKDNDMEKIRGVYVADVLEDGAAKEAGIKKGDIILKINDKEVNSVPALQEMVSMNRPGDKIKVTVFRKGKEHEFTATLKDPKGNTKIVEDKTQDLKNSLGAEFTELTPQEKAKFGIENGVKVKSVTSGKFKDAGIPKGFIITKIDKKKVNSVDDVYEYLSASEGGVLIEGIEPDGSKGYYGFGIE